MARQGGGRRRRQNTPRPGQPDQFNASGRVRTARGGTRNRGGGLVSVSAAARQSRRASRVAQQTFGLPAGNQTLVTPAPARGGALAVRGGALAVRGGTRRSGAGSGADNARSAGAGTRSNSRFRRARPAEFSQRGLRRGSVDALRRLAREGATPGERAAAEAAARRLGVDIR